MASSSKIVPFPSASANSWVEQYQQACLTPLDAGTIRVYRHILSQFTQWIEQQRGAENEPLIIRQLPRCKCLDGRQINATCGILLQQTLLFD
jgi:hypothetical protein